MCEAGRGNHYIERDGYTWRMLDGANPYGPAAPEVLGGTSYGGCQWEAGGDWQGYGGDYLHSYSGANYLPLPAGWVLAPNDDTSRAVVADHGWTTQCGVLADGTAWVSANGESAGDELDAGDECGSAAYYGADIWDMPDVCPNNNCLATSGGRYTVTHCYSQLRVLIRCASSARGRPTIALLLLVLALPVSKTYFL